MDTPPPPPPPTTTTVTTRCSEIDPPTWVPPNRMEKQQKQPQNNGALKFHHIPTQLVVGYGKCRKNHAISTGGLTLDGCGEFIPTPISTPTDLNTQKCIACGCHRSFHRCDPIQFHQPVQHIIEYQPYHHQPSNSPPSRLATMENSSDSPDSSSPPPISSSYYPAPPHMLLNINPDLTPLVPINNYTSVFTTTATAAASGSNRNGKKRFRSKFSHVQKEKMQDFAERIGWKMQRSKEDMIVGFCNEIGVTKDVFKVWMHNHKNTISNKKENNLDDGGNATTTNGSSSSF